MLKVIFVQLALALVLVECNGISMHNQYYCYSEDPIKPQIGMFATKSSYETNRGRSINSTVSSKRSGYGFANLKTNSIIRGIF